MSVTVKTVKDGRTFEMSIEAAKLSRFLANTIEEFGVDEALPIQGQVSGPTMEKVSSCMHASHCQHVAVLPMPPTPTRMQIKHLC